MTGKLIALEGIDGCGKTSIMKMLQNALNKAPLPITNLFSKEPTPDSETGKACYKAINSGDEILAALAFAVDHRHHIKNIIEPIIAKGYNLFTDRYIHSHIAYQSNTLKIYDSFPAEPINWLDDLYEPFTKYPDIVLWYRVNPTEAVRRIKASRPEGKIDNYETVEFLTKIEDTFSDIFGYMRHPMDNSIVIPINTNHRTLDEVFKNTLTELANLDIIPKDLTS